MLDPSLWSEIGTPSGEYTRSRSRGESVTKASLVAKLERQSSASITQRLQSRPNTRNRKYRRMIDCGTEAERAKESDEEMSLSASTLPSANTTAILNEKEFKSGSRPLIKRVRAQACTCKHIAPVDVMHTPIRPGSRFAARSFRSSALIRSYEFLPTTFSHVRWVNGKQSAAPIGGAVRSEVIA